MLLTCFGPDCDDSNAFVNPDAMEFCNGLDDNCSGAVDDGDSGDFMIGDAPECDNQSGECVGAFKPAALCVDGKWLECTADEYAANPFYKAGEEVSCDGKDNNCDGWMDESFVLIDVNGLPAEMGGPCGVGTCAGGTVICNEAGDGPLCNSLGNATVELCNGIDDDCDGFTDAEDGPDLLVFDPQPCENQAGVCDLTKPAGLCVDGAWEPCNQDTYQAQAEEFELAVEVTCNDGLDNDCDGLLDCYDSDCFGSKIGCEEEWVCNDLTDNDDDGLADCADPDCASKACDDQESCTYDESCLPDGSCGDGTIYSCDDQIPCTEDLCTGDGGCQNDEVAEGWCRIDGVCFQDGETAKDNVCAVCRADWGTPYDTTWGFHEFGAPCDDGNPCTTGDVCYTNLTACNPGSPLADLAVCPGGLCCNGVCRVGGECCSNQDCPCGGHGNANCSGLGWGPCLDADACIWKVQWIAICANLTSWGGCHTLSREDCLDDSPWCWLENCVNFACQ